VVTTEANELTREYHDRMPVILPREAEEEWVSREQTDGRAVTQLLAPYPPDQMTVRPVSPEVNNVRNNDPSLIEPLDLDDEGDNRE
jgi:putative SOS response-associated peptidase YedK